MAAVDQHVVHESERRAGEVTPPPVPTRGPGWWMDVHGGWNPPDTWPESNPPLPGWTRLGDGLWSRPVEDPAAAEPGAAERRADPSTSRKAPILRMSPAEAITSTAHLNAQREVTIRAIVAAVTAATLASVFASGLILITAAL